MNQKPDPLWGGLIVVRGKNQCRCSGSSSPPCAATRPVRVSGSGCVPFARWRAISTHRAPGTQPRQRRAKPSSGDPRAFTPSRETASDNPRPLRKGQYLMDPDAEPAPRPGFRYGIEFSSELGIALASPRFVRSGRVVGSVIGSFGWKRRFLDRGRRFLFRRLPPDSKSPKPALETC
jgi:hypothetical protein